MAIIGLFLRGSILGRKASAKEPRSTGILSPFHTTTVTTHRRFGSDPSTNVYPVIRASECWPISSNMIKVSFLVTATSFSMTMHSWATTRAPRHVWDAGYIFGLSNPAFQRRSCSRTLSSSVCCVLPFSDYLLVSRYHTLMVLSFKPSIALGVCMPGVSLTPVILVDCRWKPTSSSGKREDMASHPFYLVSSCRSVNCAKQGFFILFRPWYPCLPMPWRPVELTACRNSSPRRCERTRLPSLYSEC